MTFGRFPPPLAVTHRLLVDGKWTVTDDREWWTSQQHGDIWHTIVDMSVCVLTLEDPTEFVPPAHMR